jgi:thiamine pyrophosphokinase
MHCLIMTNGDYGCYPWYLESYQGFDRIICVDGGLDHARTLGIIPHHLVGDMDSVSPEGLAFAEQAGITVRTYPREKDLTDTQIALALAEQSGATSITVWGGTGSRLDHTLSNLYSVIPLAVKGVRICFAAPELMIYVIAGALTLDGKAGQTVSLIVLGDRASGVTLRGFKYPLNGATIESGRQYAVSNLIAGDAPEIIVEAGVLAVFHYRVEV